MNFKDVLIRAGKTFLQGFLGSLTVTLPATATQDLGSGAVVISLLIGAFSAGFCAVMNFVLILLDKEGE